MNKEERATLRRAVERVRRLLEDEVADQIEGAFGILQSGKVLDDAPGDPTVCERLLELITHHQAGGETAKEAVERATRELAFTTLNRFVALKMAEQRGLVRECISKGPLSDGIRELADCAPGLRAALPDGGYRLLLEAVMDEISLGLSALFDRRAPAGLIWPRPKALDELLDVLNAAELASLWEQDETIGWVYQYFNPKDEREAMRKASAAPRNSRELAVRNQFFTPRYVVAFLTDNTLGRIWYEMRKGDTALKESCRYLVRRPSEVFLAPGEPARPSKDDEADVTREELLGRPAYIEHRPKKDPRDVKVLDPACGSGHFLLYAFELLERIYEEAWADAESPASEGTGRTLREDYGSIDELRRAAPKLIIEHNLHGIDIDPRAVQIAALALWLRAQKAWQGMGLKPTERPQILRSNIVTAEPMPGEDDMRRELVDSLRPRVLGQLVDLVFERMRLAGEAGSLLKIEEEIKDGIAEAREQWLESSEGEQQLLFPGMGPARPEQQKLRFDLSGVDNEQFWEEAESRILEALKEYAERAENGGAFRRRLFANDSAQGFAFVDLCRARYDVALMNPPFGACTGRMDIYLRDIYPDTRIDLFAAFCNRMLELLTANGVLGAITPRDGFFKKTLQGYRELMQKNTLAAVADLGLGVLDSATVRTAAYTVYRGSSGVPCLFFDVVDRGDRGRQLYQLISRFEPSASLPISEFRTLPLNRFLYWFPKSIWSLFRNLVQLENRGCTPRYGLTTLDDIRFCRLFTEVPEKQIGEERTWAFMSKGGEEPAYGGVSSSVVLWRDDAAEMAEVNRMANGQVAQTRRASKYYFQPALTYPNRAVSFSCWWNPKNYCFSVRGPAIIPLSEPIEYLLGFFNSRLIRSLVQMQTASQTYTSGVVKQLPWVEPDSETREIVATSSKGIFDLSRRLAARDELDPFFVSPIAGLDRGRGPMELARNMIQERETLVKEIDSLQIRIDGAIAGLYGITDAEIAKCERIDDEEEGVSKTLSWCHNWTVPELAGRLIQYCVGCAFGRFDSALAAITTERVKAPQLRDAAPTFQPGAIAADHRDSAEGKWTASPYSQAPGVMEGSELARSVDRELKSLWQEFEEDVLSSICRQLQMDTLGQYLQQPGRFFGDHLRWYSKHGRQAPIYWPLSTSSGAYAVWVYYHRLTEDTLYRIVSDYVSPKISQVEDRITQREAEHRSAQGRDAARLVKELSELTSLLQELKELRGELLRVAHLPYRPNLNDGVQITAAPLWRLFRLPRWRSELERTWQALERGDYDWAHLAYAIWPERVRETCRRDRSIAIAHGLDELYEERSAPERPARRRRGQAG